jgi:hypothetical protein
VVYGGVDKFKVAEIVRVALQKHQYPVSRMISIGIKLLLKRCSGIELIVVFADQGENHHGGIYQASNFIYTGTTGIGRLFKHKLTGRILHNRAVSVNGYRSHFGHVRKVPRADECDIVGGTRKHRYLLPLTPGMKEIALKMKKHYPKRATSDTSDTPGVHPGERAGQHGPWRSRHRPRRFDLIETEAHFSLEHFCV